MEAAQQTAQSLYVVYRQLPAEAQKAFRELIDNESEQGYSNKEWLALSAPVLHELWGNSEEDYWDTLYEKQHQHD